MLSFVVLGLGKFGQSVAKTLYEMGHEVLTIEKSEEIVEDIADSVTQVIRGDITDEDLLKALGVRNFDAAIVSTSEDIHSNIIATIILKELGIKHIIAKAHNDMHAKVLYKLGVDKVIFPERDLGVRVARSLVALDNVNNLIELSPDYSIVEIPVPEDWVGKSIAQLHVRAKHRINIIAVKNGMKVNASPMAETVLESGEVLIVVGSNEALKPFKTKRIKRA